MPEISFLPSNVSIKTSSEENILKAAMRAGVHINASCGGAGVCNKCRIFIENGEVQGEELSDGGWKACATFAVTDITVRVPIESEMDRKALARPARAKAASWIQERQKTRSATIKPIISKIELKLPEPTIQDSIPDLARIRREIGQGALQGVFLDVDSEVLFKIPAAMRRDNWQVTATLLETGRPDVLRLVNVEPGRRSYVHLAVSIDIGTTTVSAQLLDLNSGEVLAEASDYNPQVSYGEDVISRMEFSRRGDGAMILKESIVTCLDNLINDICKDAGEDKTGINLVTVAANTVMCHFLLGLETRHLRAQPYIPVASLFPPVRGTELGLDVPRHARVFLVPCVASYVGGDIVAGVVGVGMHKEPDLTLFIDIGTNGEIVLGNQDWMACAACSAGPAFEGGGIKHGMRATSGAVEVVHIHPETFEPMPLTIGGKKARGICGSGIISLLAGLFSSGAIDPQGKFRRDTGSKHIREGSEGWEYLVVAKENAATEHDIVFTEADIENLIRAKGAMFAGYLTLLESVGMTVEDIDRVILAGNFGSYIDLEQAITIGLMPDIPRERFFFAGNSSLAGAREAAFSFPAMKEMAQVAQMMTHFDLSDNTRFMDNYVSCLFLPHTDISLFPSVNRDRQTG
jgi:uncharacterized 2Fe-2S/4Fe-4S cluster protein (DUF4445 family)